ncbi:MAG: KamA family radical SAM protein [bacterium]
MTPDFDRVWSANPEVHGLLRTSATVGKARHRLFEYLNRQERRFLNEHYPVNDLEFATMLRAVSVMKNVIAVRNERKAGFSALRLLHDAARGRVGEDAAAAGFKEEFHHLLRAVRGESRLYPDSNVVPPVQYTGREAALIRSNKLDKLAEKVERHLARYPHGLLPAVLKRREAHRRRILELFGGSEDNWSDYRWHLRHVIRDAETLGRVVRLTDDEVAAITAARSQLVPFGVTPHYAALMDRSPDRGDDHSVRAQVIPGREYVRRLVAARAAGEHSLDFMHERETSPVDFVTRRYARIAILKPCSTCAQVCVYCQRNWEISQPMAPDATPAPDQLEAAVEWLRAHPAITEVLVTGGDPLVTGTPYIARVLAALAAIDHVGRIRIGTRTPVTVPQRITSSLADAIGRWHEPGRREVCVVTHVQHVYEFTAETVAAVARLRRRGISVYNQLVYTREVSRRFEAAALRHRLRLIGIDPYYTFNTKGKEETEDFRVPIARLRQEQKEEARLMPGLERADEAVYNIPGMGKNYLRGSQHHAVIMILPDGRRVYEFHPWEKRISPAPTYVDTDVSIWDYLEWLKSRGESPRDYRSIWYYW